MKPRSPATAPILPRVESIPTPPSMSGPPRRRRRMKTRGGGWLLPTAGSTPTERTSRDPETGPETRSLSQIEEGLDRHSPRDRSRWIRLSNEAARWSAQSGERPRSVSRPG